MTDAFGKAIMDYFKGNSASYVIRRDDGWVDEPHDIEAYFSNYSEWQDFEKEILREVEGRVLDIGAGVGRHALYLQNKGFEVHAIDISPLAVEVMEQRGVKNVYLMDLRKMDFPDNYFSTILMMFNNFGLAGSIEGTKKLLKVLHRISTSKGRIITTIKDPYQTDNPNHLAYHKRNKKAGRPGGQIKIRVEYKGETGDWFSLLMVSPQELKELIRETGWSILKIVKGKDGNYGAVLEKS